MTVLATLFAALARLLGVADLTSGQGAVLALTALTVAGLLCLAAVPALPGFATTPAQVRTTLRERTLRTAFLPQRDPDADGRPRPRAPGAEIPAA
ncbi:DUF6412 domain-containing protein [Spirillospora sp. CA-294931]|uniref:DUF6412 domain-containing protein n=1 Tax=Spirillospora sp. CA-294931 TaxID=3240042 RepID=UPI003D8FE1E0